MKQILPLLAGLTALIFCSCSSTVSSRIEKNPEIYNALGVDEQELVANGQIAEGMSPGGVFLALGSPDRRLEGSSEGTRTMRWDYTSLSPVYGNQFYGGFGTGFGGWGRGGRFGRRGFGGFGFGPTVNYVPTRSGTVLFENDRVRSWERAR